MFGRLRRIDPIRPEALPIVAWGNDRRATDADPDPAIIGDLGADDVGREGLAFIDDRLDLPGAAQQVAIAG